MNIINVLKTKPYNISQILYNLQESTNSKTCLNQHLCNPFHCVFPQYITTPCLYSDSQCLLNETDFKIYMLYM